MSETYPIPEWTSEKWIVEWCKNQGQFHIEEAKYSIFGRNAEVAISGFEPHWLIIGIFDTFEQAQGYCDYIRGRQLDRKRDLANVRNQCKNFTDPFGK